jgi:lipocalin
MPKLKILVSALFALYTCNVFARGAHPPQPDLATAQDLDLSRYLGKWYEIVRRPISFEADCVGVTAEYSARSDGKINVKNSCRRVTCNGKPSVSQGLATVPDPNNPAKLKVSFFWPFQSDYWVLEIDPEYSYAVVGSPDRQYFWILSRTPSLAESVIESILERFHAVGFDFSQLIRTPSCPEGVSTLENPTDKSP